MYQHRSIIAVDQHAGTDSSFGCERQAGGLKPDNDYMALLGSCVTVQDEIAECVQQTWGGGRIKVGSGQQKPKV